MTITHDDDVHITEGHMLLIGTDVADFDIRFGGGSNPVINGNLIVNGNLWAQVHTASPNCSSGAKTAFDPTGATLQLYKHYDSKTECAWVAFEKRRDWIDFVSPEDGEVLGTLSFWGQNSVGSNEEHVRLAAMLDDVTNGTEDASLKLSVMRAGTFAQVMTLGAGGLGIGVDPPEQAIHVSGADMAFSSLLLERVQDQAYGPRLTLRQSRGAYAIGQDQDYLGHIHFRGYNDTVGPEEICYAAIEAKIVDASDGTEDGTLYLATMKNGTLSTKVTVGNTYVTIHNGTKNLAFIDAGTAGATEAGWVNVQIGGSTMYLRAYSSK